MTDILCQFCGRGENETEICGKLWRNKNSRGKPCAAHLRCMKFSSNLSQYEFYSFGGFLVDEVRAEVSRAEHLKCWVCRGYGASAGCALSSCNKSFHYYCAAVSDDCCICTIQLRPSEQITPTDSINRSTCSPELSAVNIYSIFCSKNHRTEFIKSAEDLHKVISEFQKFDLKNGGSVASPTNSGKVCADVNNVAPSVCHTFPSQKSSSCKYPSDLSVPGSSKFVSQSQLGSPSAAISSVLTSCTRQGDNESTVLQQACKSTLNCLTDKIPCSSQSVINGQICSETASDKLLKQTGSVDGFSKRLKRKKADQGTSGTVSSSVENSRKFRKGSEISEASDIGVRIGQKSECVSKCSIEDESEPNNNIINKRKSGVEKKINILNHHFNATTSGVEKEQCISYSTCRNLQLSANMGNNINDVNYLEHSSLEKMETDVAGEAEVQGLGSQLLNKQDGKLSTCKFSRNNSTDNYNQKMSVHKLCKYSERACTAEVETERDLFAAALSNKHDVLQSSDDDSDNDNYHDDVDGRPWWWLPPTAPTPPSCSSTEDKSRGPSPGVLSNYSSPVSLFGSDCDIDDNSNDDTKDDNSRNVEDCHSAGVIGGKESGPLLSNTSSNINNNEIGTKCTNRCDNNKVCHGLKSHDKDYLSDLELSSDSDKSTDSDYSSSVKKGKILTEKSITKNARKIGRAIVRSKSDFSSNGKINVNSGGENNSELNPQKKYTRSKRHSEGFCNDSYCSNDKEYQRIVATKNGVFEDQNVPRQKENDNDGKGDCIRNHISYQKLPNQSCHSDGELSSTANNCEYDTKLLVLHNNDSAQYNAKNTSTSTAINENKAIQENIIDDISLIQKFLDDNFVICKGRLNECSNGSQLCVNGENPETDAQNLTFPSSELPSPCKPIHLSDNNVGEGMRVIGRIFGTDKVSDIEDQRDGECGKCTSSVVVVSNTHCSSKFYNGKESNVSNNLNSDEELLSDGARRERDFNTSDVTDRETSDTSVEVVRKVQKSYTRLISSTEDDDDDDDDDIGFTRVNRRNQLCFTKQQQNVLHSSRKRTIKRISAASEQSEDECRAGFVGNYLDTTDTSVEDECEMRKCISSTDGDTSICSEDITQACKNEMINKNQQQHVVGNRIKRFEIQNEFQHPVGSSSKISDTNNLRVNSLIETCASRKCDLSKKYVEKCDGSLPQRQIKCAPKLHKNNNQSVNHRASHSLLAQRIQPTLKYLQRESFHQEKEDFTEPTVSPSVTSRDHAYVLCIPLFSEFKKEMINSVLAESEKLVNNAGGIKDFCMLIWTPDQVNSCDESSCECHTSSSGSQLFFSSKFVSCFDRPSQFSSISASSADSRKSKSKPSVTGVNGPNRRLNLDQSNISTLAVENENDSIITNGLSNVSSSKLSGLRCDDESQGAKQGESSSGGSKKRLRKDINKARLALEALAAYTECLKEGDGYQSLVERLDGDIHCCTDERKVLHERIESNLKLAKDRFKVKVGCVELVEISSSLSLFGFLLLLDSCDSINSRSRCRSLKQPFSLFNCPDSCRFISDSRARHHEFESLWRCVESEYRDASILIRPDQLITSSSSSKSSVASFLAARLVERLRGIRDEGPFLFILLRTDSEVVQSYQEFLKGWFRLISEEFLTGCRDVCVVFDVGSTLSCGDSGSSSASKLGKSPDVSSKPQTKNCAIELSVQDLNGSSVNNNTVPKLSPPNDGTMKNDDQSNLHCLKDQNTIMHVITNKASSSEVKCVDDIVSAKELLDLIDSSIDTSTVKVELQCGVDPECNNVSCIMFHMTLLH